jgi:hypothetical protein
MRALIVALALASVGASASASGAYQGGQGDVVPIPIPTPKPPDGVKKQAEDAVNREVGGQTGTAFRAVRAMEAKAIRRDTFAQPIDGPLSVVCGQFSPQGQTGESDYAWFLVAIKRGRVLWTTYDVKGGYTEAYYGCRAAGLTGATAATGAFY